MNIPWRPHLSMVVDMNVPSLVWQGLGDPWRSISNNDVFRFIGQHLSAIAFT